MEEAEKDKRLRSSIIKTVVVYFIVQCATFACFALFGKFEKVLDMRFFTTSAIFHLAIMIILLALRNDFVSEYTGQKLEYVNKANKITLIRLSTLPTLLFLVIAAKEHRIRIPLLLLVVFIFVTDFLDGYVSRKNHEVTRIGRMMDSASDYSLLVVLSLVFQYYNLIPAWFLILVLSRLTIQPIFMLVLAIVRRKVEPKTTWMGKVTIASVMVLYTIEILGLLFGGLPPLLKSCLEWIVGAIVIVGIIDKIISFVSSLQGKNLEVGEVENSGRDSDGNDKKRT